MPFLPINYDAVYSTSAPPNGTLQGRLSTTGIAEEKSKEVDHIVETSPAASETNLVAERVEELALGEMAGQDSDLGEPRWNGRHILWGSVNINGRCIKGLKNN